MGGTNEKTGFLDEKVVGMPMKIFLPMAVIVWGIAFTGRLPKDVFSTLIFVWSLGAFLQWCGNKTPILGKYVGFGGILPLFGASLLVTIGVISPELKEQCGGLVNTTIIPVLIGILLAGSILGRLDRDSLKKAALRYIPVIICGEIFAIAGSFIVGKVLGYDLFHSVVLVAFPCFSGGSGGPLGQIPMAITNALGIDGNEFVGYMMAGATLANVEAILLCGILDLLGKKMPGLTGNGSLVRKAGKAMETASQKKNKFDGNFDNLLRALMVIGFLVICGNVIAVIMKPIINYK